MQKSKCEHKQTKEQGYRMKEVVCLDCHQIIKTYWPMST